MTDFRSERMESREGRGIAKRAWEAYASAVNRTAIPLIEPFARHMGAKIATDLIGFWAVWHIQGGFDGMLRLGMSEVTIYRRLHAFRKAFGKHPDEFEMPGVSIDPEKYWNAFGGKKRRREAGKKA